MLKSHRLPCCCTTGSYEKIGSSGPPTKAQTLGHYRLNFFRSFCLGKLQVLVGLSTQNTRLGFHSAPHSLKSLSLVYEVYVLVVKPRLPEKRWIVRRSQLCSFSGIVRRFLWTSEQNGLLTFVVRVFVELLGGLYEGELAREGELRARTASAF